MENRQMNEHDKKNLLFLFEMEKQGKLIEVLCQWELDDIQYALEILQAWVSEEILKNMDTYESVVADNCKEANEILSKFRLNP